ncbi:MAG TPA: glycosyltransferase, partial [Pedococcus sp.]
MLLLRDAGPWLSETLGALAAQTRPPERLVVVDTGGDGEAVEAVRAHRAVAEAVGQVRFVTVAGEGTRGELVGRALAELGPAAADGQAPDQVEHLWLLTSDSAPDERALARLLDAVRRSPSVAAAGPKLVRWDQPGSLDSVGLQLTRAGRVIPSPVPGEPDQG